MYTCPDFLRIVPYNFLTISVDCDESLVLCGSPVYILYKPVSGISSSEEVKLLLVQQMEVGDDMYLVEEAPAGPLLLVMVGAVGVITATAPAGGDDPTSSTIRIGDSIVVVLQPAAITTSLQRLTVNIEGSGLHRKPIRSSRSFCVYVSAS